MLKLTVNVSYRTLPYKLITCASELSRLMVWIFVKKKKKKREGTYLNMSISVHLFQLMRNSPVRCITGLQTAPCSKCTDSLSECDVCPNSLVHRIVKRCREWQPECQRRVVTWSFREALTYWQIKVWSSKFTNRSVWFSSVVSRFSFSCLLLRVHLLK